MGSWWYCLKHNRVEHNGGCPNSERLGPFATEKDASGALELAKERNEEWDRSEDEWNKGKPQQGEEL